MSTRIRRLRQLRVFALAKDWEACARFYGDTLGLRLRKRDDAAGLALFALGARDVLSLERASARDRKHVGRFVGVNIEVDDIRRAYADLSAAGVIFDAAPQSEGWGGIITHFRDPAGNVLSLVQSAP